MAMFSATSGEETASPAK